jgi:hypothetical protein
MKKIELDVKEIEEICEFKNIIEKV